MQHTLTMIKLRKEQVLRDRSGMSASELWALKLFERILNLKQWCRSKSLVGGTLVMAGVLFSCIYFIRNFEVSPCSCRREQ